MTKATGTLTKANTEVTAKQARRAIEWNVLKRFLIKLNNEMITAGYNRKVKFSELENEIATATSASKLANTEI